MTLLDPAKPSSAAETWNVSYLACHSGIGFLCAELVWSLYEYAALSRDRAMGVWTGTGLRCEYTRAAARGGGFPVCWGHCPREQTGRMRTSGAGGGAGIPGAKRHGISAPRRVAIAIYRAPPFRWRGLRGLWARDGGAARGPRPLAYTSGAPAPARRSKTALSAEPQNGNIPIPASNIDMIGHPLRTCTCTCWSMVNVSVWFMPLWGSSHWY